MNRLIPTLILCFLITITIDVVRQIGLNREFYTFKIYGDCRLDNFKYELIGEHNNLHPFTFRKKTDGTGFMFADRITSGVYWLNVIDQLNNRHRLCISIDSSQTIDYQEILIPLNTKKEQRSIVELAKNHQSLTIIYNESLYSSCHSTTYHITQNESTFTFKKESLAADSLLKGDYLYEIYSSFPDAFKTLEEYLNTYKEYDQTESDIDNIEIIIDNKRIIYSIASTHQFKKMLEDRFTSFGLSSAYKPDDG